MPKTRLNQLICIMLILLATSARAHTPLAQDLPELIKRQGNADDTRKVMLILVSQPECSYCQAISRELLGPMQNNDDYRRTTLFARVEIKTGQTLVDFDGQIISANDFAKRYGVNLTPSLLFLDHQGQTLHEMLSGYTTPELFGFYLDQALQQSWQQLNPPSK